MPSYDKVKYLIIHTSDSPFGNVDIIRTWHLARGFSNIGYHYVILNGYAKAIKDPYIPSSDGSIELGRKESENGAHTIGYNSNSIGICLIGKHGKYTPKQMTTLLALSVHLMNKYNILTGHVLGHYETDNGKSQGKTCPDISMSDLRLELDKSQKLISSFNNLNL